MSLQFDRFISLGFSYSMRHGVKTSVHIKQKYLQEGRGLRTVNQIGTQSFTQNNSRFQPSVKHHL